MSKQIAFAVLLLCLSAIAAAQTIGTYVIAPDTPIDSSGVSFGVPPAGRTYVNLSGPAPAAATIRTVAFRTTAASGCNDTVKIKFFRRSGDTITTFAESGPFPRTGSHTKVTLPTPVDVQTGDLIGITLAGNCFATIGPIGQSSKGEGSVAIYSDASGSYDLYGNSTTPRPRLFPGVALGIYGSSDANPEVRTQVIVAAASAAGVGGSRFKTDIQLGNPPLPEFLFNAPLTGDTVLGRLVYHPEATSGTAGDPSVPFKLARGESRTILDFVGGLGLTGKGSVDVYTTVGFEAPLAVARVYEDSGGSTKGFTMDAQLPERAIRSESILFAPTDPAKFRMNIGVRTLDRPLTLVFAILRPDGTARTASVERFYPANYYTQVEASQLLGATLQAGDAIVIHAADPVFVYGSIIDNASQDPSLQFAGGLK